jgi:hypothetical protein
VSFCKDYQGGRSFYTALGNTAAAFDAGLGTHLKGAISWATGQSDPVYSDCGATVIKNYQQVKVSSPPNLLEPNRKREPLSAPYVGNFAHLTGRLPPFLDPRVGNSTEFPL